MVERIGCDLGNWEPDPEVPGDGSDDEGGPEGRKDGRKDYVRILVKYVQSSSDTLLVHPSPAPITGIRTSKGVTTISHVTRQASTERHVRIPGWT